MDVDGEMEMQVGCGIILKGSLVLCCSTCLGGAST